MAEALAVVGVVSNIIQLVDFGSKVLHRLNDFQSSLGDSHPGEDKSCCRERGHRRGRNKACSLLPVVDGEKGEIGGSGKGPRKI
jgi:hypothetical protein